MKFIAASRDAHEVLSPFGTDGRNQSTSRTELGEQDRRNSERRCSHENSIVRSMRDPALKAVAMTQMNIADVQFLELRTSTFQQRTDALDAVQKFDERRQHCGLIAAAGTDLQNFARSSAFDQRLGHSSNDVRL